MTLTYNRWCQNIFTFNLLEAGCWTIAKVILILDQFFLKYKGESNWSAHPPQKLLGLLSALLGLIMLHFERCFTQHERSISQNVGLLNTRDLINLLYYEHWIEKRKCFYVLSPASSKYFLFFPCRYDKFISFSYFFRFNSNGASFVAILMEKFL